MNRNFVLGLVVLVIVGGIAFFMLSSQALVPGNILKYPEVKVTVFYSSECKAFCNTSLVEDTLRARLLNVSFNRIDIATPDGKLQADVLRLQLVPAYIIDGPSLEANPRSVFVRQMISEADESTYVVTTIESYVGFMFRNKPAENASIDLFISSYDKDSIDLENRTF